MKIETTFSCGDRAWVFHNGCAVQLTIGQVQVVHTDSPGVEQPDIQFDNYAKQQGHKEAYMCVESGIGSGNVYTLGEHIFATEQECIAANAARMEKTKADQERRRKQRIKEELASEDYHRMKLAEIEAMKLELAGLTP